MTDHLPREDLLRPLRAICDTFTLSTEAATEPRLASPRLTAPIAEKQLRDTNTAEEQSPHPCAQPAIIGLWKNIAEALIGQELEKQLH